MTESGLVTFGLFAWFFLRWANLACLVGAIVLAANSHLVFAIALAVLGGAAATRLP